MSDLRNRLQAMFEETNRFGSFGNVLMQMHVRGFRCHSNTVIEIQSPITAFCGLNGTGKSTLLQLAAVCYRQHEQWPYYVSDFLVVGALDPNPFSTEASVEYKYWQEKRNLRTLTLSRSSKSSRWQGYRRRPERTVFFAGMGLYLPRIEKRDFIVREARKLSIENTTSIDQRINQCASRILARSYETMQTNTVKYYKKSGKVVSVKRSNTTYSEAHMGCGEGRAIHLVTALEGLPDQSLVLIEEPETSLHPSAQYEFGRYLVEVCIEKRHQVILSTHSEFILEALPSASRIYLNETSTGIEPIIGLTASQAKSLMAQGCVKALSILVEDECAASVLREIIRSIDPTFLRSVGIHPAGDCDTIAMTVRTLQTTGLPVTAVRDADRGPDPSNNIFALPGSHSPEREILNSQRVRQYFESTYAVVLQDLDANLSQVDHHKWFRHIAERINHNETALLNEAARVYVGGLSENDRSTLTEQLKEAARR